MMLAIYGAGGLGREFLELVLQLQAKEHRWDTICFTKDGGGDEEKEIHGVPVIEFQKLTAEIPASDCQFVIAVGEPVSRAKLLEKVKKRGYSLASLIHPSIYIPASAVISEGAVIKESVYIGPDTYIGENTLLQGSSIIGHDAKVGNSCTISSHCVVCGGCAIGDKTYLGVNVSVREKITIGNNTIIGMGSVVQRDVPDNVIAMGNPARPMKTKNDSTVFH